MPGYGRRAGDQSHEMGPVPVLAGIGVIVASRAYRGVVVRHPVRPSGILPFVVADYVVAVLRDAVLVAQVALQCRRRHVHPLAVPGRTAHKTFMLRPEHPCIPTPHVPGIIGFTYRLRDVPYIGVLGNSGNLITAVAVFVIAVFQPVDQVIDAGLDIENAVGIHVAPI